MKTDFARRDVEHLVEGQRLGAKLLRQVAVGELIDEAAGNGAVVMPDDGYEVFRLAHVELDVVDAKPDRVLVSLGGGLPADHRAPSMRADQRHT